MTRAIASMLVVLSTTACIGSTGPGSSSQTREPDSPYATTREEFLIRVKACVEDKGFEVELDTVQGGFRGEYGTSERVREASQTIKDCMRTVDPTRLAPPPPPSEAQLRAWYRYQVARARCLTDAGYDIGTVPPEQVFVDTNGNWDPFAALIDAGTPAGQADRARCERAGERPSFLDW